MALEHTFLWQIWRSRCLVWPGGRSRPGFLQFLRLGWKRRLVFGGHAGEKKARTLPGKERGTVSWENWSRPRWQRFKYAGNVPGGDIYKTMGHTPLPPTLQSKSTSFPCSLLSKGFLALGGWARCFLWAGGSSLLSRILLVSWNPSDPSPSPFSNHLWRHPYPHWELGPVLFFLLWPPDDFNVLLPHLSL